MKRGYIKLWRKSLDGGLLQNHKLWTFWCWCLLKASHKKHKQLVGFQEIELDAGQFVFGREKASKELKISERCIRTCLDNLKKTKKATIKTTNKFSIITIVNWGTYQDNNTINDLQNDRQQTSNRLATDHKQEGIKKGKKEYIYMENSHQESKNQKPIGPHDDVETYHNYLRESNPKLQEWFQKEILNVISEEINIQSFNSWFEPLTPIEIKNQVLYLHAPKEFFVSWLEEHYRQVIDDVLKKADKKYLKVNIKKILITAQMPE